MMAYIRDLIRSYSEMSTEKINVNNIMDERNSFSIGEESTQMLLEYYIDGTRKEKHYCMFEASFPQTDDPSEQLERVEFLEGLMNFLDSTTLPDSDKFFPLELRTTSSSYQYVFRDTYIRYRFRFTFEFKTKGVIV